MRALRGTHTADVAIMVACGLLLVVAVGLAARWRHRAFRLDPRVEAPVGVRLRGLAKALAVGALTGLTLGVLVVGPGGRLAMRLMAATSPDAQGRLTEAGEVIGDITLEGTIGFFIFVGLPFGLAAGLVYVLVARAFPSGLLGGAVFAAALLVLFSTRLEPLRADNRDFDLVGPGWLAVAAFGALAIGTGLVAAPIAGRIDAALGEPRWRWLLWAVPLAVFAVPVLLFAPLAWVTIALGVVVYLALPAARAFVQRRGQLALRVGAGLAVLVTLPGFLAAIGEIVRPR